MGCKDDACHRAESSDDQSLRDVGSEMVDTNPQLMQLEITNSRKRCLCVMIHVCPSHRAQEQRREWFKYPAGRLILSLNMASHTEELARTYRGSSAPCQE